MAATRDPSWWERLDDAFQGALDLPPGERTRYLDRACGTDLHLRAEVEAMLAAEAVGIERLVHDEPCSPEPDPFIGMRLGPWRIVDPLGHGGMGTVYLAERADGQYEQRVALKIIRSPSHQPGASPRFKAEAHILGRLSHPNIARLLDAGVTPEGSAYLVMEYVDGCPVTTYCDAHHLTIEQRLRLFRTVADATQHAHQSLVVHRDLKPSNIFVSRAGEVKLLDFGIAKLLEADHPLADQTMSELRALTPAYAAPEQLRGETVTTAADVYVLGAVLYELLTGYRPVRQEPAAGITVEPGDRHLAPSLAIRRRLKSHDNTERATLARIADARGTSASRLGRRLEGDTDRLVLKALHPEPQRRYASAGQLAEDIERLLDGRPVLAQPDSFSYRLRRFVGRHRVGVTMTVTLCTVVIAFAIFSILQARAVVLERDRARLEATRAERVSVLVADLFKLADPGVSVNQSIAARELLDQGASRIASQLAGDPEMQAPLFNVVGRLYSNLSLHDAAIDVLLRALTLEQHERPQGSLTQAETMHWLAELYVRKNDYAAAEQSFLEALRLRRALGAPQNDIAATLEALGRCLSFTGRHNEAETPLREAVEIRRRESASPGDLMSSLNELAVTLHRTGNMAAAEPLFREAAEIGRRIPGVSPEKMNGLLNYARLVQQFDRNPQRAEPIYRDALRLARSLYPQDHQDTATILGELARDVRDLGRLPEAEMLARESMQIFSRLFGTQHRETMISSQTLASVLSAQGRPGEAETLLREALLTARALFKEGHPMTLGAQRSLASVLDDEKRFPESLELRQAELASAIQAFGEQNVYVAISLVGLGLHGLESGNVALAESSFRRALDIRRQIHPPGHWRIDEVKGLVGVAELRSGRLQAAEPDLLAAYEGLRSHRGPTAEETLLAGNDLVELYERRNRPDLAQRYRTAAGTGLSRFTWQRRDH